MSHSVNILWADDEIEMLKPHILLLEEKGFEVSTALSGAEAIEMVEENRYDIVFLDENMPGLTGLEALGQIKKKQPDVPVVMVTKSEEEFLMEDAIGSQISDYLIKPVNPKQILLTIKKLLENKRLVSEKVSQSYQMDFRNLAMKVNEPLNSDEWVEVYKQLVYWDLELEKSDDESMKEIMHTQKSDANANFSRFIEQNYLDWLQHPEDAPVMSHNLLYKKLMPMLDDDRPTVLLVLDNFRFDQWKALQNRFNELFEIVEEDAYYSILPTATSYARNAIFSGLMPRDIQKRYPDKWLNDDEKGGKNLHEEFFLNENLERNRKDLKVGFHKITKLDKGKALADNAQNLMNNDLSVVIYNFVDLLSHVRTEMEVLKELAEDEAAYRSLTQSWFDHSPLHNLLKQLSDEKINLLLTTDHGSIRVKSPSKVVGDRNTSSNLRYKHGKSLNYSKKDVFAVHDPVKAGLPKPNVSSAFIFAQEDRYFVYPNNYNHFVRFFKDTFQHGGISLEEVIVPVVKMKTR